MIQRGVAWFRGFPPTLIFRSSPGHHVRYVSIRRMGVKGPMKKRKRTWKPWLSEKKMLSRNSLFVDAWTEKSRTDTTMSCTSWSLKTNSIDQLHLVSKQVNLDFPGIFEYLLWGKSNKLQMYGKRLKDFPQKTSALFGLVSQNDPCSRHGFPCPKEHLRYRWHLKGWVKSTPSVGATSTLVELSCVVPLTFEFVVVLLWRQRI